MTASPLHRSFALAAAVAATAASFSMFAAPAAHAAVFVGISVGIAPPPLPVYVQPPIPSPGYIWTPGYWAWGPAGYYWVPGVWVQPPSVGVLWTPGYWGWGGGAYLWHAGYWGPHVGFYGGVNYGFGYGGVGFFGGEWRGGSFFYNSAVANVTNIRTTNVYVNRTVIQQNTIINNTRVSYNGGNGGINRQPTPEQQAFANQPHMSPTINQQQHQNLASQDRSQLASVNGGRPQTMATANPGGYRQIAQRDASTHPITAQDRQQGLAYHPNTREANQDQRIANGLRNGQMTSGEASRAENRQANIDQQVRNDRAANGGRLTGQERQQINGEQNRASQQIYNENHNGNTIGANQVNNREANQEQRIANGQRSGQMTSGEAARAQRAQSFVGAEAHADRSYNGGALNAGERGAINRQQNGASRQIYNENHNANAGRPHPQERGGGERRR